MDCLVAFFVPAMCGVGQVTPTFIPSNSLTLTPPAPGRLAWEEPFGPVLPIIRVKSVEEAVAHVNANRLALQVRAGRRCVLCLCRVRACLLLLLFWWWGWNVAMECTLKGEWWRALAAPASLLPRGSGLLHCLPTAVMASKALPLSGFTHRQAPL